MDELTLVAELVLDAELGAELELDVVAIDELDNSELVELELEMELELELELGTGDKLGVLLPPPQPAKAKIKLVDTNREYNCILGPIVLSNVFIVGWSPFPPRCCR